MPHPHETEVNSFFKDQKIELNRMFPIENTNFISQPDMSIGSTFIGHKQEYNDAVTFWEKIKKWKKSHANTIPANGFLEVRPFYSTDAYKKEGNCARRNTERFIWEWTIGLNLAHLYTRFLKEQSTAFSIMIIQKITVQPSSSCMMSMEYSFTVYTGT